MEYRAYRGMAWTLGGIGLMASLALSGCATTHDQDAAGAASSTGGEPQVTFPEPGDAWSEEGTYVNLENLEKMQVGTTKDQVYDLLGRPHFSEGLFGVREWNYIFHLPTPDGDYMTCQYQVQFDDEMLAESLHWRESQCAALLEPQEEKAPEQGALSAALAADALFDFDSASLSAEGRRQVTNLAERINEQFTDPEVMVIGHTDRLGSAAYNQTLSERRAANVRAALADSGIALRAIRSRGAGEHQPVTRCEGSRSTPGLRECLRPNRRVDIEVSGVPR